MTWIGLVTVNMCSVRNNTTARPEEFTMWGEDTGDAGLVQDFISKVALSKGQKLSTKRLSTSVNATEEGKVRMVLSPATKNGERNAMPPLFSAA